MKPAAVLFIVFKRYDTTKKVWEAFEAIQPAKLYIAADGPRSEVEVQACKKVRELIKNVSWPCDVHYLLREKNRGLKYGFFEAVSWFFEQEEEGIIIEDDCVPSADFFRFTQEMLEKYRDDTRIMQISGSNFQPSPRGKASYFLSRYNHVWGWATWRRAWMKMDLEMTQLHDFLQTCDKTSFWDSRLEQKYWKRILTRMLAQNHQTWDYQWKYSIWKEGGLTVYPNNNMINNIGFGVDATHTSRKDKRENRAFQPLEKVTHPPFFLRDRSADAYTFKHLYWGTWLERLAARFRKVLRLLGWKK